MHLTVINDDADVAGIRTRERTLLHLAHDTLQNSGHEAGIDGTADDAVDEHQLAAPFQVDNLFALGVDAELLTTEAIDLADGLTVGIGLDDEVHLAELTGTAGLLLVAIVGAGSLRDLHLLYTIGSDFARALSDLISVSLIAVRECFLYC